MKTEKQWLFFDRTDISTATTAYEFQDSRMTDAGREHAEVLYDFWNFHMKIGTRHGMAPLRVPFGIRFEPEKAHVTGSLFPFDRPWETGGIGYISSLWDDADGYYKVWYGMRLPKNCKLTYADGSAYTQKHLTLYARSRDMKTWEKPALGEILCDGVVMNAIDQEIGEGSLFLDAIHPETGRYKVVNAETTEDPSLPPSERVNLRFYGSDDGLHFRLLDTDALHYFFDTQNIVYYDEKLEKYVAYLRGHYNGRAIQRAEADTLEHMPMPSILLFPDNEDPMDCDYYNNCSTVYPYDKNIRLMFPSMYYHTSDELDVRMAYSRNGRNFQWISREPVIGNYDENGDYYSAVYASPHMLPLGDKVGVVLRTATWLHNEAYFGAMYSDFDWTNQGIRLATWERDRFAGIVADEIGEFWLEMKSPKNAKLQINARTKGQGRILCELVPKRDSTPYAGYSMENSVPFAGDHGWTDVVWQGVEGMPELPEDRTAFLRIRLEKAKIFGVRLLTEDGDDGLNDDEIIVSANLHL